MYVLCHFVFYPSLILFELVLGVNISALIVCMRFRSSLLMFLFLFLADSFRLTLSMSLEESAENYLF